MKMYEIIDGDYYASFNLHLFIPDRMNIAEENEFYRGYRYSRGNPSDGLLARFFNETLYRGDLNFENWLLMRGAKRVTKEQLSTWCEN